MPAQRGFKSLSVRIIRPNEELSWDELMNTHHYLAFRRLAGESIKYVDEINGKWVALMGWGTAALKCAARDGWIGWTKAQQFSSLYMWLTA